MTYKELYARACKKGKLREDEYSTDEYINDVNDLQRTLWTTIFQGVNGNKPKITRSETFTVSGDTEYVFTRTINDTPILKIVLDDCTELTQKTDEIENIGDCICGSFEYDDDEIRLSESADGDYEVFYEAGTYTELTSTLYDADATPDWFKADFHPILWSYPAWLNTDTKKDEMGELFTYHKSEFEKYYSRTETLEENVMRAEDVMTDQL